jgi:hypothetical protein
LCPNTWQYRILGNNTPIIVPGNQRAAEIREQSPKYARTPHPRQTKVSFFVFYTIHAKLIPI